MTANLTARVTHRAFLKACGLALAGAAGGQLVLPPRPAYAATTLPGDQEVTGNLCVLGGPSPNGPGYLGIGLSSPRAKANLLTGTDYYVNGYGPLGGGLGSRYLAHGAEPGVMLSSDFTDEGIQGGSERIVLGLQIGWPNGNRGTIPQLYYKGKSLYFVELLGTNDAPLERMVLNTAGNLGVGVSSPMTRLDVQVGAGGTVGRIYNSGTNGSAGSAVSPVFAISSKTNGTWDAGNPFGALFAVGRDNTNSAVFNLSETYLTVLGTGQVGVGNTQPGERLDVTGNVRASGAFYAGARKIADASGVYFAD